MQRRIFRYKSTSEVALLSKGRNESEALLSFKTWESTSMPFRLEIEKNGIEAPETAGKFKKGQESPSSLGMSPGPSRPVWCGENYWFLLLLHFVAHAM